MLIRSARKKVVWLAIGLGLAACANLPQAVEEAGRPDLVTDGAAAKPAAGDDSVTADAATEEPAASPTPTLAPPTVAPALSLPDLGPAPDITNEVWLNTDRPLNLAALRGKAVLVEFWTFG